MKHLCGPTVHVLLAVVHYIIKTLELYNGVLKLFGVVLALGWFLFIVFYISI